MTALETWRVFLAFFAVGALGLMVTSMILYGYARRKGLADTSLSPGAQFCRFSGSIATLVYIASFRVYDLFTTRPYNMGDVLSAPPVFLFGIAGVLLVRSVGRALSSKQIHDQLEEPHESA